MPLLWSGKNRQTLNTALYQFIFFLVHLSSRAKRHRCSSFCELIRPNVITLCMFSNVVQTTLQTLLISPKTITETFVKVSRVVFESISYRHCLDFVIYTLNNKQYVLIYFVILYLNKNHIVKRSVVYVGKKK